LFGAVSYDGIMIALER